MTHFGMLVTVNLIVHTLLWSRLNFQGKKSSWCLSRTCMARELPVFLVDLSKRTFRSLDAVRFGPKESGILAPLHFFAIKRPPLYVHCMIFKFKYGRFESGKIKITFILHRNIPLIQGFAQFSSKFRAATPVLTKLLFNLLTLFQRLAHMAIRRKIGSSIPSRDYTITIFPNSKHV